MNNILTTFNAIKLAVSIFVIASSYSYFKTSFTGIQKQPVQWGQVTPLLRLQYLERYSSSATGQNATGKKSKNIDDTLHFIRSVNENNCNSK